MCYCLVFWCFWVYYVSCAVYFNCNIQSGDHLKICKLFQSMNLNDIGVNLDNYNNYCGLSINNFRIECLNDNNTIITLRLSSHNFESLGYEFNFTDNLGLPSSLTYIDFYRLRPVGSFNFEYIYPLNDLERLDLSGLPNNILTGTIDWIKLSQMPNLRQIFMQYRLFDGDIGAIKNFSCPLEKINLHQCFQSGTFDMKSLNSVQNTLTEFLIGDPKGGLTTNLDLNVFTNFTKLRVLDIHLSSALGTIKAIDSLPLPSTLQVFHIQRNNLNDEIDWNIFRNIKNMISFRIFDNSLLNGTVDWDIVKNMYTNTGSNEETIFRIKHTGLSGNNANFIGLNLWWIEMDTTYQCDSNTYCKEEYGFYSMDRSHIGFGRRQNILPECTCLCSNGTLTVISDLCPTTNFTWAPTASPTKTPSIMPSKTPSLAPSITPTESTALPTLNTQLPTLLPTMVPSKIPSLSPSLSPSIILSILPTRIPSTIPSSLPTELSIKTTTTNKEQIKTAEIVIMVVMVVIIIGVITSYQSCKLDSKNMVKENNTEMVNLKQYNNLNSNSTITNTIREETEECKEIEFKSQRDALNSDQYL